MVLSLARLRQWDASEQEEIRAKVEILRPWHYSFDFGGGLTTRQGQHPMGKFEKVLKLLPSNLDGSSCLDCPSNNAQLSMLLKDRGAGLVVAKDIAPEFIRQAEFLTGLLGYDIRLGVREVYTLKEDEDCRNRFDYVFCLGLLYHLTDMFGALRVLASLTKRVCFIETAVLRIDDNNSDLAMFIEGRYASDDTNWWIPGVRCVIAMCRASGFKTAELVDYYEPAEKVTNEGYRMPARGIFKATMGVPQSAKRLEMKGL